MSNKNRLPAILYYLTAIFFILIAIMKIGKNNGSGSEIMYLGLGAAFLACGSIYMKKNNRNDKH